ncbi:MAG: helix-hairpin-helix domain-containing protein, partial [Ferruginibacter sp.]
KREDMIKPIKFLKDAIIENRSDKKVLKTTPKFIPAGQSTQMVIGATPETDLEILYLANGFYKKMNMRRVYYSGYVPISNDNRLPAIGTPVPMIRENRLYQADWLMRFYGFGVHEIVDKENPLLDMDIDPKLGWALRNRDVFPVDINTVDYQLLIRVPGIGIGSAKKIIAARKFQRINWDHLKKIGIASNRARYFIYDDNKRESRDWQSGQIKQFILSEGVSKYKPNFTPQLKMF